MKILVANLGSTSFKYRLFDMAEEKLLARGGIERIGAEQSPCTMTAWPLSKDEPRTEETTQPAADHAAALRLSLDQLVKHHCLKDPAELAGVGFKAVHAQGLTGVQRVDEKVLAAMAAYNDVAPAHNPPYVQAMRLLAKELPNLPLVAAFETGFHETITPAEKLYAVPLAWAEQHGVKRWGFHGASHRYIAERAGTLLNNRDARIVSCHLGGSSSLCAIQFGHSVATSMGMSPQTGLPHNNRVGDFDPFALPPLMRATGKTLEQLLDDLANRSGLLALSDGRKDLRDIEAAAQQGDARAELAIAVFVASIRHYLGAYLLLLGGADAIVFTGGIGENSPTIRAAVCFGLDWFGIGLDDVRNQEVKGETAIHTANSRVQVWIVPANEELIVARQTKELLQPRPV